ncbi:MAG TPA: hypothetical protein VK335_28260 [Bryobacteraceae bacterium]|nr:hypothetical protein [Bryobacteraceae bacterium]HZW93029.1 hypothetical protein [Candidatus Eremiobacteraceae bacterium]
MYCTAAFGLARVAGLFALDQEFGLNEEKHEPSTMLDLLKCRPFEEVVDPGSYAPVWQKAFYLNSAMLRIMSATERYLHHALTCIFPKKVLYNEQNMAFLYIGMQFYLVCLGVKTKLPDLNLSVVEGTSSAFNMILSIENARARLEQFERWMADTPNILTAFQKLDQQHVSYEALPVVVMLVNEHKHRGSSKDRRAFPVEFCVALLAFRTLTDVFCELQPALLNPLIDQSAQQSP